MSTKRYASAIVARKNIQFDEWMEELRAQNEGAVPKDVIMRTAKTVLRKCDPKQYLLSHATIVASVDTVEPKNVKTGMLMNRGCQIAVKWPNFRVKPECHGIINNNGDAWERSLLLSTYRTFIGAHNYLEHIQLPELSKGFIVDAIARDLGSSCYVDILVATDRKHNQLVSDILSGAITGLSMGCISLFTICSKCGNVAADDSQICPCVAYDGKLSKFIDEQGQEQVLCELIGHVSVAQSNQFIEASWVRNPAFRGAVRRNFLNADANKLSSQMSEAKMVYEIRAQIPEMDGLKKAASTRRAQQDQAPAGDEDLLGGDQGGQDQGDQGGDDEPADQGAQTPSGDSKPEPASIDKLLEKAQEKLLDTLIQGLDEKLKPKAEDVGTIKTPPVDLIGGIDSNENFISSAHFDQIVSKKFFKTPSLVKWASKTYRIVHEGGRRGIHAAGLTPNDLLILSWIEDRCKGRTYSDDLYKTAMKVGPLKRFPSRTSFIAACKMKLGRELTAQEQQFMEWKGRIASIAKF